MIQDYGRIVSKKLGKTGQVPPHSDQTGLTQIKKKKSKIKFIS